MDGFKWGGVDKNGKPFGLVADMKVIWVLDKKNCLLL